LNHKIITQTYTQLFYSSLDFVWDNPGELIPEGTFRHLLDFHRQVQQQSGWTATPTRLTGAPISAILTIFTPDALPGTTLPIYPGLGQAPNMLACTPSGLVNHKIIKATKIRRMYRTQGGTNQPLEVKKEPLKYCQSV